MGADGGLKDGEGAGGEFVLFEGGDFEFAGGCQYAAGRWWTCGSGLDSREFVAGFAEEFAVRVSVVVGL